MNNILIMLGRKNRFNYRKLNPHNLVGDSLTAENPLVDFVKNNVTSWPFVLLKHHLPMDFEKYGLQQPTYINVIRDPSDWFQSHYYFERFGWTRKEDDRGSFIGSEEDKMRVCRLNKYNIILKTTNFLNVKLSSLLAKIK